MVSLGIHSQGCGLNGWQVELKLAVRGFLGTPRSGTERSNRDDWTESIGCLDRGHVRFGPRVLDAWIEAWDAWTEAKWSNRDAWTEDDSLN